MLALLDRYDMFLLNFGYILGNLMVLIDFSISS